MAWHSLGRSPAMVSGPSAPPPSLWERPSAASPRPSTYLPGRLNPVKLYYTVQYQNAQGRTRAGAGVMMRVEWRAGGISCVLLARAILYKVCPSGGMGRGGSSSASFRADQGRVCQDRRRAAFRRSDFSREPGVSFPGSPFVHFAQFNSYVLCKYTKYAICVKCC